MDLADSSISQAGFTKASLATTNDMDMAKKGLPMDTSTKASIRTAKCMAREFICGPLEIVIMEIGIKE